MRIVAQIAMDRQPAELVADFVDPLDETLRAQQLGRVLSHAEDRQLNLVVPIQARGQIGNELVLQCLAEAEAPTGTVVYQKTWWGRKRNIDMLGP